jgi:hypothetical protein
MDSNLTTQNGGRVSDKGSLFPLVVWAISCVYFPWKIP